MSQAKIYLVDQTNRRLTPMIASYYPTEDELQRYLADYADLIPGDQINPEAPRRWLLVGREVGVPDADGENDRWSLDHLFLDQDGIPTFVECKRAVDTRTRREVVAQMLDYAANGLAYWSIDRIRLAAAETAERRGQNLAALLLDLVNGSSNDDDVEAFWEKVEAHMREQQVRLIFVVDEAPRELRQLVEFLNRKLLDVDVLIVEIKQYQGEGMTALAPRVLGVTEAARAQRVGAARKPKLTAQQYLANVSPVQQQVTQYVWEEAEKRRYIVTWAAKCFAVRVQDPRTDSKISFLYGFESRYDFYFDGVPFSPQDAAAWRRELLATGVFRSSGLHTLRGVEVTEDNKATIIRVLQQIFERMDALLVELAA